ncbi:hypothetical protein AC579_4610 [Pseudocercospora musae]|uniref:Uncharacterized protein n=1 Tax=Pseudocercospora musae TaxID=113226 RepID=A0A139I0U7_9PEZI|nr:hypothetical protein AC579_4610 [Pseudocercospora musae]KXT08287.1 hypothetical protein AC579_4610 [Pseudocercospora musae]KXT08289.1 hypothetical protein AC579_4610 [Pseudocercospora musae]
MRLGLRVRRQMMGAKETEESSTARQEVISGTTADHLQQQHRWDICNTIKPLAGDSEPRNRLPRAVATIHRVAQLATMGLSTFIEGRGQPSQRIFATYRAFVPCK